MSWEKFSNQLSIIRKVCKVKKVKKHPQILLIGCGHGKHFFNSKSLEAIQLLIDRSTEAHEDLTVLLESFNDSKAARGAITYVEQNRIKPEPDLIHGIIDSYYKIIYKNDNPKQNPAGLSSQIDIRAIDYRESVLFLQGLGDILMWLEGDLSTPKDISSLLDSVSRMIKTPSDGISFIQSQIMNVLRKDLKMKRIVQKLDRLDLARLKHYASRLQARADKCHSKNWRLWQQAYQKDSFACFKNKDIGTKFYQIGKLWHNYSLDLVAQVNTLQAIKTRRYIMMIAGARHINSMSQFFIQSGT